MNTRNYFLLSLLFSLSCYAMQLSESNDFQEHAYNYLGPIVTKFCRDQPDDARALFFTRWVALTINRSHLYRLTPSNATIEDVFPEALRDTPFCESELSYIETGSFDNKPITPLEEWNATFENKKKEIKRYYRCQKR